MTTQRNKAGIKDSVLTSNTAQGVFNYLRNIEAIRPRIRTRWIWELLQNARDTSVDASTHLTATIEYGQGKLTFLHNGRGFKEREIAHLIFHGSTKIEEEELLGQYGSGFLTTHLLSSAINISGQLNDGQWFDFCLERKPSSVSALQESMDRAWEDFVPSPTPLTIKMSDNFTTRFVYPIVGNSAVDAVEVGIAMLKQCAPFVVVFNKEFSRIEIKLSNETMHFEVIKRSCLGQDGLQQITVAESKNENQKKRKYLLAQGEKASIVVPIESKDGCSVCMPLGNIPRLFLGFPLIGTGDFSFPAVINSLSFTPTEDRDGVFLLHNNDDKENKANIENQAVIEEACELLIKLLQFVASSGWSNVHLLANIPAIHDQKWLNSDKLRETLREQLIEKLRQTPAVINEAGVSKKPVEATLPLAKMDTGVEALWELLDGIEGIRDTLPRRNEAIGWWRAVESWTDIYKDEPMSFDEVMDGEKLALYIQDENCAQIEDLQDLLGENIDAVKWLDKLHDFLNKNELREAVSEYHIALDQAGFLDKLSNLHRDPGIAEELKDIAELLGWEIRQELRDKRLSSLTDKVGKGDMKGEPVVRELITRLQERAEDDPDDNFAEASVRLFTWIVDEKDWDRLRGLPVFTKENDSGSPKVLYLPRNPNDNECPLAPVGAWPEGLQPFSELFPLTCILGDAFFKAMPEPKKWQILNKRGFVKTDVITTSYMNVNFKEFFPEDHLNADYDGDHKAVDPVAVKDFVGRVEIMARVRDSRARAFLFWRFLTEWLIKQDAQVLEIKEAKCECGDTHEYYQAAWLMPVREDGWIRIEGGGRATARPQPLGSLLKDNGWKPSSLSENPAAINLLEVIGVTQLDVMRELLTENDKERNEQDSILAGILVATDGDLSLIHELVQDMKVDPKLPDYLEERRKRIRMVHENQHLGKMVEELVKESLEGVGFAVKRKPIGSDFEIEHDLVEDDTEMGIELSREDQSWLVEVKATQGKEVRMTSIQARNAVKHGGGFLLCVVPMESGNTDPELDEVKKKMRFIKNIGPCISPLCDGLDDFEDLRENITSTESSGVQLEVVSGTARIRVDSSVWENDGFPLENLADHLK